MRFRINVPIANHDGAKPTEKGFWGNIFQPKDTAIEDFVERHLPLLARKRTQLLIRNEYGKHNKKGWEKELSYFISDVLIPAMPWWHPLRRKPLSVRQITKAATIIERLVADECYYVQKRMRTSEGVPNSGIDYELFCQRILEANSWKVTLTKKTGDQGVDLVGQIGSHTVAFQCKRFAQPVGNKAVQEVTAGRKFYGVQLGAIITNSNYTTAAEALAAANGVLLLHHDDLPGLAARLDRT